jgi:formaldehyde-activating enzyme involved in methanogenesis
MSNLNRSPKLRLQAALFDLIEFCDQEQADDYGIREIWHELQQSEQEQIWAFMSSAQKNTIRDALANDPDKPAF